MRIVIAPKLLVVGLLLVGLIDAAQTSAQKVEKPALNPVLLGSDASGTLSFSYPRSCIGKAGAVVVGTHATIFESGQQQVITHYKQLSRLPAPYPHHDPTHRCRLITAECSSGWWC